MLEENQEGNEVMKEVIQKEDDTISGGAPETARALQMSNVKIRPPKQWFKFQRIYYQPQKFSSNDFRSNVFEGHQTMGEIQQLKKKVEIAKQKVRDRVLGNDRPEDYYDKGS